MTTFNNITTQFDGGISSNSKSWLANSCRFSRNLSIYEDSDSVSLNPKPIKDSGSTVVGLVKWIVDSTPYATDRYAVDDAAHIYKITSSNVWSLDRTITATPNNLGQGLIIFNDFLYYTTSVTMGRKGPLSQTPAYADDFLSDGTQNMDLNVPTSGSTYTTPVAISEAAANTLSFTPTKDPLATFRLWVVAKGTGNWTVTIHDAYNNVLGSATVANATLTNGAYNDFTFTPYDYIRVRLGSTLHAHVTSTVADGTLRTTTLNTLSTMDFKTFIQILTSDQEYHPMILHTNGVGGIIVIANGQYMATWDGSTFLPNKITIEPGYRIRGWARENEFVVAYAWKGTAIDSFEEGRAFYWDGISTYYNYSKPIEEGSPNAMIANKNRIFSIVGSSGLITMGTEPFMKLQVAPKLTKGYRIEVMPGAITNWQSRALWGYANTTDPSAGAYDYSTGIPPTGIEQGVYEWGNQSDRAIENTNMSTEVLNFAYNPSTTIASPLSFKIGCVKAFGKDLYISYKDGSTYYVDRVNKSNVAALNGSWESTIVDYGINGKQLSSMPMKSKNAIKLVVTFIALPTGCTVTPKYKLDRAANWTLGTAAVAAATRAEVIISGISAIRYKEIEYGFDLASSAGNYPTVTGVYFEYDPLGAEVNET